MFEWVFYCMSVNVCVIGEKIVFHKQDAGASPQTGCPYLFFSIAKESVTEWQDLLNSTSSMLLV